MIIPVNVVPDNQALADDYIWNQLLNDHNTDNSQMLTEDEEESFRVEFTLFLKERGSPLRMMF